MTDRTGISHRTSAPLSSDSAVPSAAAQAQSAGVTQKLDLQQLRDLHTPPPDHPHFELPEQSAADKSMAPRQEPPGASPQLTREAAQRFLTDGIWPPEQEEFQALAVFLVRNRLPNALSWLLVQSRAPTLDLQHCELGNDEAGFIAEWARDMPFQLGLDLAENQIDAGGAALLADALAANTITNLNLGDNPLLDEGVQVLCAGLGRNSSLRSLELYHVGMTNPGVQALADVLDSHPSLSSLELHGNAFDENGASLFAVALGRNTTLSHLLIGSSMPCDTGLASLARALITNTHLTALHLRVQHDEKIEHLPDALADALVANQTLTKLSVFAMAMADPAAVRLAAAMAINTTLTEFDLWLWTSSPTEVTMAVERQISDKAEANALIAQAGVALSELSQLPEASVPIPPEVGQNIAAFAAQVAEDERRMAAMRSLEQAGPLSAAPGPDSS